MTDEDGGPSFSSPMWYRIERGELIARCHHCKARIRNRREELPRTCINGCCQVVVHRRCGSVRASWGPVGCSCNEKIKLLPKLARRSARRWR